MKHYIFSIIVLTAGLFTAGVYGHHAISLEYEEGRTGTIEGVVDEVFWANPHVHYYLTVTKEDGTTETWDMETPNISVMMRRGIRKDTIQPGDELTVIGTLGRNDTKRILADAIARADGTVIMGEFEYGE